MLFESVPIARRSFLTVEGVCCSRFIAINAGVLILETMMFEFRDQQILTSTQLFYHSREGALCFLSSPPFPAVPKEAFCFVLFCSCSTSECCVEQECVVYSVPFAVVANVSRPSNSHRYEQNTVRMIFLHALSVYGFSTFGYQRLCCGFLMRKLYVRYVGMY